MTRATTAYTERYVEVLGGRLHYLVSGSGEPAVILHRDNGYPGWQPFHSLLAERHRVYALSLPGFQNSDPPSWSWLWTVRDVAIVVLHALRALDLTKVTLIGLGFGGWLAAEMATMCEERIGRMVLVSPMGILPREGEIFDQFLVGSSVYARRGFHDEGKFEELYGAAPEFEQLEAWETDREMTSRVAWKPYMYNRVLPGLLRGVAVPTLVVWGRHDRIVPLVCGEQYVEALPHARLEVVEECGHVVDLERPAELARLVEDFCRGA